MEKLKVKDILKLAAKSKVAKETLTKLANGGSEFNENVPAMSPDGQAGQASPEGEGAPPVPPVDPAAAGAPPVPEAAAAPQMEAPEAVGARAAQNFLGPEVLSAAMSGDPNAANLVARTAGQVAGAVAESATKAIPQVAEVPTAGVPATAPANGAAVVPSAQAVPATPEEDLANEIVPPQQAAVAPADPAMAQGAIDQGKAGETQVPPQAAGGPTPAGPPQAGPAEGAAPAEGEAAVPAEGEMVDQKTVAKLIQLAKAGKI